jgi:hypothetical protein
MIMATVKTNTQNPRPYPLGNTETGFTRLERQAAFLGHLTEDVLRVQVPAQVCTRSMWRRPAPSEADIRCGWQYVRFVPKADIRQRGALTNPRGGQADIDWSLLHVGRAHTVRAKLFLDGWSLQ